MWPRVIMTLCIAVLAVVIVLGTLAAITTSEAAPTWCAGAPICGRP